MSTERMREMIRAGIIGSTGYAGQELVRILLGHKDVEIKWYGSRSYIDQAYASVFQNMFQLVPCISCRTNNTCSYHSLSSFLFILSILIIRFTLCSHLFVMHCMTRISQQECRSILEYT